MKHFSLRYYGTDVELPIGDFVVGRSTNVQLVLDDALVSRQHAVFHVAPSHVTLEDLGSRNGVRVNDIRISTPVVLSHQDRVGIGAQELVFTEAGAVDARAAPTGQVLVCHRCGASLERGQAQCASCGHLVQTARGGRPGTVVAEPPVFPTPAAEDMTRQASAFSLLAGIVDKALALGRPDEAERILANLLTNLFSRAQRGTAIDDASLTDAALYALRVADATGRADWLDWVFRLYRREGKMLPAPVIDGMHILVRRLRYPGSRDLRDYVAHFRERAATLGPTDKFLLQRLEGIERVVGP